MKDPTMEAAMIALEADEEQKRKNEMEAYAKRKRAEYRKRWRQNNRERVRETQRRYRQTEKGKATRRNYTNRPDVKARMLEYQRQYRKNKRRTLTDGLENTTGGADGEGTREAP